MAQAILTSPQGYLTKSQLRKLVGGGKDNQADAFAMLEEGPSRDGGQGACPHRQAPTTAGCSCLAADCRLGGPTAETPIPEEDS